MQGHGAVLAAAEAKSSRFAHGYDIFFGGVIRRSDCLSLPLNPVVGVVYHRKLLVCRIDEFLRNSLSDQGIGMVRPDKFAVLAFELLIGNVPRHSQDCIRIGLVNAVCGADTTKRRVA